MTGGCVFAYLRDQYKRQPRPIRRLLWWWLLPFAWMTLLFLLIALRLMKPGVAPAWMRWIDPWGMFIGQFIAMGVTVYKTRRISRDYNASGGRLCTECGHSLRGLADVGLCPECGHTYDIELDRLTWRDANIELTKKP